MTTEGRALVAGYEWRQRFVSPVALFPAASTFTAQVRRTVADATVLTTLTTADGDITRIDNETLEIVIPGADSTAWTPGSVVFDVVRTDTAPDQHLGFRVEILVVQAVTRI